MMPTTMTVHAFVDESRRSSRYFVAVAIAEPAQLRLLRRELRCLVLPGQSELHFSHEKDPRRRELADVFARLPIEVQIYSRQCGRQEEATRQECVEQLTRDLLARGAHRLVLDSRSNRDVHDQRTIRRTLGRRASETNFVYEHLGSTSEPLLWIADAAAWCVNRGGPWRLRIDPIISAESDLDVSR